MYTHIYIYRYVDISIMEVDSQRKVLGSVVKAWLKRPGPSPNTHTYHTYMCIYIYIYVCVCVCRCMCACVYIYIYICVCVHTSAELARSRPSLSSRVAARASQEPADYCSRQLDF